MWRAVEDSWNLVYRADGLRLVLSHKEQLAKYAAELKSASAVRLAMPFSV